MAADWSLLATKVESFNVAEVDCTIHKTACSAFGVRGYPTLKFISGGQVYDFKGPRTVNDWLSFGNGGYKSGAPSAVPAAYSA